MVSRRNIRVKVMQVLYMLGSQQEMNEKIKATKVLQTRLADITNLFLYLLHFLIKTALYAETDAKQRASKHLLTREDLNVNKKISANLLLQKILKNESFKNSKPIDFDDTNQQVKKIYQNMAASEAYQKYIGTQTREKNTEAAIIKFIFTDLMLPDENFTSHLEEHFMNWDDDAGLMNQLMLHFLQKPDSYNLEQLLGDDKWQFAKQLLETVIDKKELITDMIKPRLKNWDSERIALLDMILMRMGVCEFLFFETIPPKVTINEYIDLAKEYSTEQSGHFVNGILDSIHKELLAGNKIHKIDFKQ
ncbi:MAG: transcription antitermination factor NusB [Parafilimonas sp.]